VDIDSVISKLQERGMPVDQLVDLERVLLSCPDNVNID